MAMLSWPDYSLAPSRGQPLTGSGAFLTAPLILELTCKLDFFSRFYEDDTEVTMDKLLLMVQKGREL